jgi:GT2 family glycosyltransferase
MAKPTISVNICVYDPGGLLEGVLDCMTRQETHGRFTFEIVVIDDDPSGSTAHCVATFASSSPVPIRYVEAEGKGVSHARNTGVENSYGTWIAWFDQDQSAEPNWLPELYSIACETGADWVDGPRDLLLTDDQKSRLNDFLKACLGEISEGNIVHQNVRRYASCTGNALVRKSVFETVGGFDESIIDGWEDWDYMRRLRAQGFTSWYSPRAIVHHIVPPARLERGFFLWHAARVGAAFACRDMREWGLPTTVLACIARLCQAVLFHAPLVALAKMRGDKPSALTRKCLFLRAVSYARRTLNMISPALFPQDDLRTQTQLRNEPKYGRRGGNGMDGAS